MHTANINTATNSSATIIPFPSANDRPARAHDGAPAIVVAFPAEKAWRQALRDRRVAGAYAILAQDARPELLDLCERAPAEFFLAYFGSLDAETRARIDAA